MKNIKRISKYYELYDKLNNLDIMKSINNINFMIN